MDILGIWVGAVLTLLVFSYLIADTFLFRLAQALFVGVAIGYGTTVILNRVLWQGLIQPLVLGGGGDTLVLIVPLVLGLLLLMKFRHGGEAWNALANIPLGALFGIGAALALGGALSGTLVPQFMATASHSLVPASGSALDLVNNILIVVGTLGTLLAFRFTTGFKSGPLQAISALARGWGWLGRGFLLVALGALFASALSARLAVLVNQVYFLVHDLPLTFK